MTNFDSLKNLLEKNRSVRRFDSSKPVKESTLRSLVELTRFCASGRNLQPLRYRLVHSADECAALFPSLAWAGYYKDWDGPSAGERPVAYLVQCIDTELAPDCLCDDGLQLEAISLGATALGIAGCIIKAFNVSAVSKALSIPERFKPRYVLALGYPAENVKIVELAPDSDIKYYRDNSDTQCVPKRSLEDLIIN
ncbi:MAG: nitroreductase family protein [Paramuribaculum sp.]|nr:nitroreductase family protein [Paramuribaculum sp.]